MRPEPQPPSLALTPALAPLPVPPVAMPVAPTGATPVADAHGPPSVVGRFAPSPSGPLHRGSIVAALGSWLDARAGHGQWLLRIEDIDPPRERPGAAATIASQLTALGLAWDGPVLYQSRRHPAYARALDQLAAAGLLYGCRCTRREAAFWPRSPASGEAIYPGTCREAGLLDPRDWASAASRRLALRWRLPDEPVRFVDRRLGPQDQHPARDAGDPVLRRADGLWAYQLAVVVDDADSAITDVVRGLDLLPGTGRQILLQQALGLPTPRYLHLPLLLDASGRKLSKHEGAAAAGLANPLATLIDAARLLALTDHDGTGLGAALGPAPEEGPGERPANRPANRPGAAPEDGLEDWLAAAVSAWGRRYRRL